MKFALSLDELAMIHDHKMMQTYVSEAAVPGSAELSSPLD